MTLVEEIGKVAALSGYVFHRKRATDHGNVVQSYTFWFKKDGVLKDFEVRFLVPAATKETPEATILSLDAQCYGVGHIVTTTPFKTEVETVLPKYQSTSSLKNIVLLSVNEKSEVADLQGFSVVSGVAETKRIVAFKEAGKIVFNLVKDNLIREV